MGIWRSANDVKLSGDEPGLTVIKDGVKLALSKSDRVFFSDGALDRAGRAAAGDSIDGISNSFNDVKFIGAHAGVAVIHEGVKLALGADDRVFLTDQARERAGAAARASASVAYPWLAESVPYLLRGGELLLKRGLRVLFGMR